MPLSLSFLWWGSTHIRDQSRDFHTANYSKLINHCNLISCTHMQSACWCVAMRLKGVWTTTVWMCVCRRHEPLSDSCSQIHTLPSPPKFASHQRDVFRVIFVCWQDSTMLPPLNRHQTTEPPRLEGGQAGWKASHVSDSNTDTQAQTHPHKHPHRVYQ